MISSSVTDLSRINSVNYNEEDILIIAEGLTMYLTENNIKKLFIAFKNKFNNIIFMFDAYSKLSLKLSKLKNPAKDMGAKLQWALDNPKLIENIDPSIKYVKTQYITDTEKFNLLE